MSDAPTPTRRGGDRGPREWFRLLGVAVQFLTRIPVRPRFEERDLRRAGAAFPLVGVLVAAIGVAVRWASEPWLGATLATVLSLVAMALVTGAFHEDGLADSADGLWGGRTPEDRLRIMRDSRVGAYGALALILLVAVKVAALAPMSLGAFAATLVPAMALGRGSSLVLMRIVPLAPGSLATLAGPPAPAGWVVASVTCGATLVGFAVGAWMPLVATALVIVGWAGLVRRKVGGISGDLLGAADQLTEVAVLLCGVVAFVR